MFGVANSYRFVLVLLLRGLWSAEKLSEMADAASNLAGALICYLALRPGDFLAIDKKALVRPIPVNSPMTGLDIPWILSFINWHKDWVCPRPRNLKEKENL